MYIVINLPYPSLVSSLFSSSTHPSLFVSFTPFQIPFSVSSQFPLSAHLLPSSFLSPPSQPLSLLLFHPLQMHNHPIPILLLLLIFTFSQTSSPSTLHNISHLICTLYPFPLVSFQPHFSISPFNKSPFLSFSSVLLPISFLHFTLQQIPIPLYSSLSFFLPTSILSLPFLPLPTSLLPS